jgi:NADH:ubiquinone oxidoreductase subunit 4 (subunit M)
LLLQIAHGLSSSALFLAIGSYMIDTNPEMFFIIEDNSDNAFLFIFFFYFLLGQSWLSIHYNFVSELLIFLGLFSALPSVAILTLFGVFLSAIYSFTLLTELSLDQPAHLLKLIMI